MGKNKRFFSLVIFILVCLFAYGSFFPHTYQKQIEVQYPLSKIYELLSIPSNIAQWYIPFSSNGITGATYEDTSLLKISSGEYALQFKRVGVTGVIYTSSKNTSSKNFHFNVTTDSAQSVLHVVLTYKSTLLAKWLDRNELEQNAVKSLDQLKIYIQKLSGLTSQGNVKSYK